MIFMQVMKKSSNSPKSKLKMAARFQAAKKTTLSCQTLKETRPLQLIGRVWCKFSSGAEKDQRLLTSNPAQKIKKEAGHTIAIDCFLFLSF